LHQGVGKKKMKRAVQVASSPTLDIKGRMMLHDDLCWIFGDEYYIASKQDGVSAVVRVGPSGMHVYPSELPSFHTPGVYHGPGLELYCEILNWDPGVSVDLQKGLKFVVLDVQSAGNIGPQNIFRDRWNAFLDLREKHHLLQVWFKPQEWKLLKDFDVVWSESIEWVVFKNYKALY
jgi:hypothetical protein